MKKRITLKYPEREVKLFARRSIIIFVFIGILVLGLVVRLFWLQIFQHRLYVTLSQKNHINFVPVEPKRGLIYDRNGLVLAENLPVFSLEVLPGSLTEMKGLIRKINDIIPISENEENQFLKSLSQRRLKQEVQLKLKLTEEEVARFYVNQFRLPGVSIKAKLVRHYTMGDLFSPVIGYVGRINENEIKQIDASNYAASDYIGKLGIEKYYEHLLHGQVGYEEIEVDASGHKVRTLAYKPPVSGENLYLSIDTHLQSVAYEALKEEVGALVAIDPNNGQVLAMVSHPSYDPNLFVLGISHEQYEKLQNDDKKPLHNRALQGQYSIGSTIKPFLALVGLKDKIISQEDTIFDPGYYQHSDHEHIYHDWLRRGHGIVNLRRAIVESCDTYFYHLGLKLGVERIDRALWYFGFGAPSNLDISEEASGLVASPAWKKKRYHMPWFHGDTLNLVIGQGYILSTPLQLAQATAILAARGVKYTPTLLKSQQLESGVFISTLPRKEIVLEAAQKHWNEIHDAMQAVITSPRGTAHYLNKNLEYTMAVKTGTAQVFSLKNNEKYNERMLPKALRDNKLFIAFAPVEKPEIAVATVTEHSLNAGIVTKKVMDAYFQRVH